MQDSSNKMCRCRNMSQKQSRISRKKVKRRRPLMTVLEEPANAKVSNTIFSDIVIYALVVAVAVVVYVNSLNGEFVHDDIPAILENDDVTGKSSWSQLFSNDFWGTPMADVSSHKSYRPLTTLSFRINYSLAGVSPWLWHVVNLALHAAACALVLRMCVVVVQLKRESAILAALLFAVHPIHTEAVAGVVGRADVIACILYLSSILAYHRPSGKRKHVNLSIALGGLSMMAKETGITVLFVNMVFDVYRTICLPMTKDVMSDLVKRVSKILLSLGLLMYLRLSMLHGTLPVFSDQDNPAAYHSNFFVRLMTFSYLAAFNFWLLLCPSTLSHDWQMGSIDLVTSFWDPRNLLTCAAFGVLIFLVYRCFCDVKEPRHVPGVMGVLLLVIPFIPASNLFITVGFVVAERVLYIPSVGSVILTAYGVQVMWRSFVKRKTFIMVGLVILISCGSLKTCFRCSQWKDKQTLIRADLVTVPENAKLHYNFGNFLRETEQHADAIRHYKEAVRLWPTYASAHNNLGTLLSGISAENHYLEAIKHNKYHANAHYNLGVLYKKKNGSELQAIRTLEKCIALQPQFLNAYVELFSLYPMDKKISLLDQLVHSDPNNWENYMRSGKWLIGKGYPEIAVRYYLEALRFSFRNRDLHAPVRVDLISLRAVALLYRSLGQTSRTFQLLVRWHTWRRGWLNEAAVHLNLRHWRMKLDLMEKAQYYAKVAAAPKISTCIDYSQLLVDNTLNDYTENNQRNDSIYNVTLKTPPKDREKKYVKRREFSKIIKTTHNKSEIRHKIKEYSLQKKHESIQKNSRGIPYSSVPLSYEAIFETV